MVHALTQSSGVTVSDNAINIYQELKLKKKYKFAVFKISADKTQIDVEKTVDEGDYDKFIAAVPKDECRYAVYDFDYTTPDGPRNKLLFFVWVPESAKPLGKMLYASSKEAIKRKLDGIFTEIQCTDASEISHESVLDKVNL
jgi:cofilin